MPEDLQALEVTIAPLLEGLDLDLVDIELRQGVLCVTVTRGGGLDLAALSAASRAVSDLLDAHEELTPDSPFELEVSSPGLERRLRRPAHFQQALGQKIAVRTTGATPGARRDEGLLVRADERAITIVSAATNEERELAYSSIDRAHTIFDWKQALADDKRDRADGSDGDRLRAPADERRHDRHPPKPTRPKPLRENQR